MFILPYAETCRNMIIGEEARRYERKKVGIMRCLKQVHLTYETSLRRTRAWHKRYHVSINLECDSADRFHQVVGIMIWGTSDRIGHEGVLAFPPDPVSYFLHDPFLWLQ